MCAPEHISLVAAIIVLQLIPHVRGIKCSPTADLQTAWNLTWNSRALARGGGERHAGDFTRGDFYPSPQKLKIYLFFFSKRLDLARRSYGFGKLKVLNK